MSSVMPLMASDTTAARLLDLTTPQFLELVNNRYLPPGQEIAPGVLRWDTENLRKILNGEGDDDGGGIEW